MIERAPRTARKLVIFALLTAVLGYVGFRVLTPTTDPGVCSGLARQRITTVFLAGEAHLACPGVRTVSADERIAGAMNQGPAKPLVEALGAHKGAAIAVTPGQRGSGVGAELGHYAHVPGLRGVVLTPELAIYAPLREPELSGAERDALAYVARALFRGAREPSIASFPAALRKVERVEVMVTLSEHGEPRLWRSARGTSIARALLTATRVARDRWQERETAMGGPLIKRLLNLDVEVSLLSEDGTLASAQRTFIDKVVTPSHGAGFDYRSGWHYLLPSDVEKRGKGSTYRALTALASEQALPPTVLAESTTRLYRFVVLMLGVSKAPLGEADSRSTSD